MLDINFTTETIVYNMIELENGETLSVNVVYEEILRLTDKAEEKVKFSERMITRYPDRQWLVNMGAFVVNEDGTLSKGENFDKVKATLKEKKTIAFFDDDNDEE